MKNKKYYSYYLILITLIISACGDSKVEKFDAEGTTILKANPDYWEGAPKLAEVHVIAIPDGQARIQALLTGQIDMNRYVPFNQKKIFDGN